MAALATWHVRQRAWLPWVLSGKRVLGVRGQGAGLRCGGQRTNRQEKMSCNHQDKHQMPQRRWDGGGSASSLPHCKCLEGSGRACQSSVCAHVQSPAGLAGVGGQRGEGVKPGNLGGPETRELALCSRKHLTKPPFVGLKACTIGPFPTVILGKRRTKAKCASNSNFQVNHRTRVQTLLEVHISRKSLTRKSKRNTNCFSGGHHGRSL